MDRTSIKNLTALILTLLFFLISSTYAIIIYINIDNPPSDNSLPEVNLPIIEWSKYNNLSKQLPE